MKRVLLSLLGLILLAILAYFCFQDKAEAIREDLISSTNGTLVNHNITGVTASLKGHDVEMTDIMVLSGEVETLQAKAEAETLTRAIDGIGDVDNQLKVVQETTDVSPTDETIATATAEQEVSTPELNEKNATADSYTLKISKDETNNIVLEGYVEEKKKKSQLLSLAKKLFGTKNVTDKLMVKAGAPKNWEYISSFSLERLKDVDYGEMILNNQSYEFTAHLPSPSSKAAFLDGIREVMSDPDNKYSLYRGDYIITAPVEEQVASSKVSPEKKDQESKEQKNKKPRTVKICQTELNKILGTYKILFNYNKASIKKDSYRILDKILVGMKNCNVSLLEIAGHTDSIGSSKYNQKLSNLRALSVKKYLVNKGFDKKRLKATGYGESKPIASNASKKGRAKNRRIEFIVKGVE